MNSSTATINKSNRTWLVCFLIAAVVANIVGISVIYYFAAIILLIIFVKSSDEDNFYVAVFLLPMIRILDGVGFTFMINLLLAVPLVMYCLKKRKILINGLILLLMIIEFVHVLVLGYVDTIPSTISAFFGLIYCYSIFMDKEISLSYERAWTFLTTGVITSSFVYFIVNRDFLRNIFSFISSGRRFAALNSDPNIYALFICLSLAMFFTLKRQRVIHYIAVAYMAFLGLLTGSKSCIMLMLITIILGLLNYLIGTKDMSRKRKVAVGLLILIFGATLVFHEDILTMIMNISNRAGLGNGTISLDRLTGDRYSIVQSYLSILASNVVCLLVGYGLHYDRFLIHDTSYGFDYNYQAHNTYLDVILSWGIVGVVLFVILLVIIVRGLKHRWGINKEFVYFLPCLILMLNLLTLSCLYATMFWWAVFFAILPLLKGKNMSSIKEFD